MVYAWLADGRDTQGLRELDMALAPTQEAKQKLVDEANMEAMKQLQGQLQGMGGGMPGR